MRNFKRFVSFALVFCMLLSLSVSAFAAETELTSGTIPNSNIHWSLDEKGWLTLSGSGGCDTFTGKDDQPWAAVREQITQVWFDDVSQMEIADLAYWFEYCINLTHVELPLAPSIGRHAFYNCPKLNTITMYYGEVVLNNIGEDAFWRETDLGDTLTVYYILGYPEATVPFYTYDWAASNRSSRQFEDVYGIADLASVVGNCPSCGQYSLQATYVSETHSSRGHQEYAECYKCHYVENYGTYVYKDHGDGTYGSWTCPSCGSHTWVLDYSQGATCTSNGYRSYSCACGKTKTETIYSSGHSYRYGSWEQYSSTKHRRENYCYNCGDTEYEYSNHSLSYSSWSKYSDSQHSRNVACGTCGYSTTEYGNHSYSNGSWSSYSDTQHVRTKTCSSCGASTYEYADHSYSYGSWSKYDDAQHRRTKKCSTCGDSSYEYADHTDSNGDGKCDDCGATVSLMVTWDAGTNGGKIGGKSSISETVTPNSKLTAPGDVPTKTGHTFKGWYTASSGGSLYTTVTAITTAKTFYAQFTANTYTVTWDLGTGETATSSQTYGETLVLPTEPERKNAEFLGWFTEADGGTQVTANTVFTETSETTYYAHWEITEIFSVTVPVTLPLVVDESGEVHTGEASIINTSTGAVQVSSVSITAKNGWTLVPYNSDMSHVKVDSNQLGFRILNHETDKTGSNATFIPTVSWIISEGGSLTLDYDAVVSALSQPITNVNILSVLFVIEWA